VVAMSKEPRPVKRPRQMSQSAMIRSLIAKMKTKLETEETKGSVADLLKLLAAEKEFQDERGVNVVVTWIDPKVEE